MSITVRQTAQSDPGTSASATAVAFAGDVLAGSSIEVFTGENFTAVTGVTDSQGNSYTNTDSIGTNQILRRWVANNVSAGPCTVTATLAGANGIRPVFISEISEAQTAPNDGHTGQRQATPGFVTDAVTSGNTTSTYQPALVTGMSMTVFNSETLAGTGFTDGGTGWATSGLRYRYEYKRVTATGNQAATFTAQVNDVTCSIVGVFKELLTGFGALVPEKRNRLVI